MRRDVCKGGGRSESSRAVSGEKNYGETGTRVKTEQNQKDVEMQQI